ncbi:urate hydroxylase PuuD, partial [Acinetobacter baumannii]
HHYPMTYGAQRPWLVLALLGATGVAVRHVFNLRHRDAPTGRTILGAAVLALASVTYVTAEKAASAPATSAASEAPAAPTFASVEP